MPPFCNKMSIQRHQSRSRSRNACHASSTAQMSNTKLLLTFVLLGLFIAVASAVDEKKSTDSKSFKPAPSASTSSLSTLSTNSAAPRDEIYIDDEGIEGSGGRGEIHDDLEKDPDYSGSGFGPDDEDSSTDHHQSIGKNSGKSQNSNDNDFITSRTSNSGTIIGSSGNAGSSGIIDSSNTGINSIGKEYQPPYPPQQQPHNNHPSTQNTNNSTTTTTTTTTASSSLFPPHPSNPTYPDHSPPRRKDDDYDDFDLDETIGGASGDGIHDSDDDNTGDDDIDEEIIKRVNHMHDLDKGNTFIDNADDVDEDNDGDDTSIDGATKVDEEIKHRTNPYSINTLSGGAYEPDTPRVAVGATETNSNDKDQSTDIDVDGDVDEEDEDDAGTDVYTDVTDTTVGTHKRPGNNQGTIHELDATNNVNSLPTDTKVEHTTGNEVLIMSDDDRTTSFFAQPGILAAVIGGAVVGLLCAILVVMFIVYRMRKKDEGSYALDEPKRSPAVNSYAKNANNREFYA